jgi:hypothetical protein
MRVKDQDASEQNTFMLRWTLLLLSPAPILCTLIISSTCRSPDSDASGLLTGDGLLEQTVSLPC